MRFQASLSNVVCLDKDFIHLPNGESYRTDVLRNDIKGFGKVRVRECISIFVCIQPSTTPTHTKALLRFGMNAEQFLLLVEQVKDGLSFVRGLLLDLYPSHALFCDWRQCCWLTLHMRVSPGAGGRWDQSPVIVANCANTRGQGVVDPGHKSWHGLHEGQKQTREKSLDGGPLLIPTLVLLSFFVGGPFQ